MAGHPKNHRSSSAQHFLSPCCTSTFRGLTEMALPVPKQEASQLLDLREEVLELILLSSPVTDRVRTSVTCKRLYRLVSSRPALWQSCTGIRLGSLSNAEAFMIWLNRKRELVRSLGFRMPDADDLGILRRQTEMEAAILGLACTHQLQSLELAFFGKVALGGWAPALQSLRYLSITGTAIRISSQLSQLTQLESLSLSLRATNYWSLVPDGELGDVGPSAVLEEGCLPSSLRSLRHLSAGFVDEKLPRAIHAATQLTRLATARNSWERGVEPMRQLTALRAVGFEECSGLPGQLSLLTRLEVLGIQRCSYGWGGLDLRPLAHLTRLSQLALVSVGTTVIPQEVLQLQHLTYLDLSENWLDTPLCPPGAQLLGQLRELALPAPAASVSADLLPRCTALTALHLTQPEWQTDDYETADEAGPAWNPEAWMDHLDWDHVLGAVAQMPPQLRMLGIASYAFIRGRQLGEAAFAKLSSDRAELVVGELYSPQPPGLRPGTWQPPLAADG